MRWRRGGAAAACETRGVSDEHLASPSSPFGGASPWPPTPPLSGSDPWPPTPPLGGSDPWPPTPPRRGARAWVRAHPRVAGYGIVGAFVGIALLLAAVSLMDAMPTSNQVPQNQAGYLWCCSVRDVSAQWTVPTLVHPAPVGAEAVWVGAQTDDGQFFLQVGTNEYVSPLTSQYQAFWSDGPLKGTPQNMGNLAPGDVVQARLVEGSRGWVVSFTDQTQGWTHTARVRYAASAAGAVAEWIEEDPVSVDPVRGSALFHMAATRGTTVSDLLVNDAPPAEDATQSETFVDGSGTTFSPTSIAHDAFGFRPW